MTHWLDGKPAGFARMEYLTRRAGVLDMMRSFRWDVRQCLAAIAAGVQGRENAHIYRSAIEETAKKRRLWLSTFADLRRRMYCGARPADVDAVYRLVAFGDDRCDRYFRHRRGELTMNPLEIVEAMRLVRLQPFVALVTSIEQSGKIRSERIRGQKTYERANGIGSKGIQYWYSLNSNCFYFVQQQINWNRCRRFYISVAAGQAKEVSEAEVRERFPGNAVFGLARRPAVS